MSTDKRLIAINLPQFHPFKENDEWWGKGFTEWTNVVKARPRFKGHYQPHLPSDTGFYDLRLPEAREMQAEMARTYGIYGFCYYHYWFNGKQLMERPVNEILASGKPNFPFMLCWANENWTRVWDGQNNDILMKQEYSNEDDIAHIRYLCENVFRDPRYIKVQGRPFFAVYRPYWFPNAKRTIETWRKIAASYNLELYLGFMQAGPKGNQFFFESGFDIAIDFQPKTTYIPQARKKWWLDINVYKDLFYSKLLRKTAPPRPKIIDYKMYVDDMIKNTSFNKQYPGITPGWDNSPRKKKDDFIAFINNTPQIYGRWLRSLIDSFEPYSSEENFIFINAWNEWGEGNHLEPDQKWGLAFLEETHKQVSI